MHFKTRRILPAIVVIGAIAAGGAAYTAGSGFGSVPTAGYSGTAIQGPTSSGLSFTYSKDGAYIQGATFTLAAPNVADDYTDATTYDIQAGFGVHPSGTGVSGLAASNQNAAAANECTVTVGTPPTFAVSCDYAGASGTGGIPTGDTTPAAVGASETNGVGPVNTGADQFNVLVTTINPTN